MLVVLTMPCFHHKPSAGAAATSRRALRAIAGYYNHNHRSHGAQRCSIAAYTASAGSESRSEPYYCPSPCRAR